jgi:hypothetical protein
VSIWSTELGASVSPEGWTDIPLRSGAQKIFVHPGHENANDNNPGTDASQPKATWAAARSTLNNRNAGDKILFAQGATIVDPGNFLLSGAESGYDTTHLTDIASYDPADPENYNLYGAAQGDARPIIDVADAPGYCSFGTGGTNPLEYFALRGVRFGGGDGKAVSYMARSSRFILLENDDFYQCAIIGQYTTGEAYKGGLHILRNCAHREAYKTDGDMSNGYFDGVLDLRIEGGFSYMGGWKGPPGRDALTGGGTNPTHRNHNWYLDNGCGPATVRNHLSIDGSATGLMIRCGGTVQNYAAIDNAIAMSLGGEDYNVSSPNGVPLVLEDFLFLGGNHIRAENGYQRAQGLGIQNTTAASRIRRGLLLDNPYRGTINNYGIEASAIFPQPTLGTIEDVLSYNYVSGARPALAPSLGVHAAQANMHVRNCILDNYDPSTVGYTFGSGNKTVAEALADGSFNPTGPTTRAEIYEAMEMADRDALVAAMIANTMPGRAPWAERVIGVASAGCGRSRQPHRSGFRLALN